jgi:hypothetical protein
MSWQASRSEMCDSCGEVVAFECDQLRVEQGVADGFAAEDFFACSMSLVLWYFIVVFPPQELFKGWH